MWRDLLAHAPSGLLLDGLDLVRHEASRQLRPEHRAALGQFLTPAPLARMMASLVEAGQPHVRILDAGAGIGALAASLVSELSERARRPERITVTAYELDATLLPYLAETLTVCDAACQVAGIAFDSEILQEDFVEAGVAMLRGDWFAPVPRHFDAAILNPPYRKIASASRERMLLHGIGIETTNLYTAFLTLAVRLLEPGGELVAITPRSFANGPYFRPFREEFLREMAIRRLHVFASRDAAFRDDDVLQENVILHAVKDRTARPPVLVTESDGGSDETMSVRMTPYDELVRPGDLERFIHLLPDTLSHAVAERMARLPMSLSDLGLSVSTGRVVDFRAREFLRPEPASDTAPLIYPTHLAHGFVTWPKRTRKPNALLISPRTDDLLVPEGTYVLVKRFSAKEERRRVVAAVYDPTRTTPGRVGFENHLNYVHRDGHGLSTELAKGLTVFLNSTLVDEFFRQFSGHTQVNATDLRSLRYPSCLDLEHLGAKIGDTLPPQDDIDRMVEEDLVGTGDPDDRDPIAAKRRIDEALSLLKDVGLPKAQQGERSALTLLALLDLQPQTAWANASAPLLGIASMMTFMKEQYGKEYKTGSRESVRKETAHQFLQAAIIVANPDDPSRPTNSPLWNYQVEPTFLELARSYGSITWEADLRRYLTDSATLQQRYAAERLMERIPVTLPDGTAFTLSPGGQNVLVKQVIDEVL